MMKTFSHIGGVFLIGFLVLAGVLSALAIPKAYQKAGFSGVQELFSGSWATLYEEKYDEELVHHSASVDLWGAAGYALFQEGKEGVLIGQDGWLFTAEEFDRPAEFEDEIASKLDFIDKANAFFKDQSVKLLIVPVPAKARVYAEHLGRYEYPSYWEGQYDHFVRTLHANNIAAIDLLSVFWQSDDQLYLKTDTHWNPQGARVAAQAIAAKISRIWPYLSFEEKAFVSKQVEIQNHEGDLLRYVASGKTSEKLGLAMDQLTITETQALSRDNAGLFGDTNIPITLVGTSYSANALWNFDGFLKEAFQADVLNVADEGLGPFEVMQNYLQDDALTTNPPQLVIWEIPERYLPIPYDLEF